MHNEMPKYHEIFIPILKILADEQQAIHHNEFKQKVWEQYYSHLSEELCNQKTQSGHNLLFNRIGWGITYLKLGKFLDRPSRGFIKITDKGRELLNKGGITLKELRKDADFTASDTPRKDNGSDVQIVESNLSPQDLIDAGFESIEKQAKSELLERLWKIDPYYFEKVVLILLKKMGYGEFIETSKSGDGGIDGIINQDQLGIEKIYIQAKRYAENNKVRESEIRNFIGAMSGDTTKGVFVTTSSFDQKALLKAENAVHKIILIDGIKLVDLMYQFGVGVQVKNTYETKEVDDDFFEED